MNSSDPGTDTVNKVTVYWGDGTNSTYTGLTLNAATPSVTFPAAHTYKDVGDARYMVWAFGWDEDAPAGGWQSLPLMDSSFNAAGTGTGAAGLAVADWGANTTDTGRASALQPDGKLVIVGDTRLTTGTASDFAIARFNVDGTPDLTFNTTGRQSFDFGANTIDRANAVAIERSGC